MAANGAVSVGLLWRAEWDPIDAADYAIRESCRLRDMFAAFAAQGVEATPVVYLDARADEVREQLLGLDGVLVWVNPIEQGLDRARLDALLRDVASAEVWVSAHPDVIGRMATKRVLVDTAPMAWSAEVHLYGTLDQLKSELPRRAARRGPLVLKQQRGMGGVGVWKVEAMPKGQLRVQHAEGGAASMVMPADGFFDLCAPYFADNGLMVEQPFQPRLAEGMIRVYLSHDTLVGFAHQYPRGLLDAEIAASLPREKRFDRPSIDRFASLRERIETEWVGELQRITGVPTAELPVIWDADFLYGPKDSAGRDTFVLCEINASSTFAFPEFAMPTVAEAALDRIAHLRRSGG